MDKMTGEIVSEEEAAIGLGFDSVIDMRRWETEMGQMVSDLQWKLTMAERERDSFRWNGRRMQIVLEKIALFLEQLSDKPDDLLLAIGVVTGKAVDWHHRLRDWFIEPCPAPDNPAPAASADTTGA
jgi:hypothetical protein